MGTAKTPIIITSSPPSSRALSPAPSPSKHRCMTSPLVTGLILDKKWLECVEILTRGLKADVKGKARAVTRSLANHKAASSSKPLFEVREVFDHDGVLFEVSEGAPDYVTKALEACGRVECGDEERQWRKVVQGWLRVDAKAGSEGTEQLISASHPPAVGQWIAHGWCLTFKPDINDISAYHKCYKGWWGNCVPEWREAGEGGLARGDGDWDELCVTGQNGIVSAVVALGWWLEAVLRLPEDQPRDCQQHEREYHVWVDLAKNVVYSSGEMMK
ncbi:hypothetical protein PM082_012461 [Marasmius tenuissimus]|nr:hypothetical protein PM082_012461 [Marasmius tenuissimus]